MEKSPGRLAKASAWSIGKGCKKQEDAIKAAQEVYHKMRAEQHRRQTRENEQQKEKLREVLASLNTFGDGSAITQARTASKGDTSSLGGAKATVDDLWEGKRANRLYTADLEKQKQRNALNDRYQPPKLPPLTYIYWLKDHLTAIPEKIATLGSEMEALKVKLWVGTYEEIPNSLNQALASIRALLTPVEQLAKLLNFWVTQDDFAKLTESLFKQVKTHQRN